MLKVTISEKGQISIPAFLHRRYGLKKGGRLAVEDINGAIVLRPIPRHPLLALRGTLRKAEGEKLTDLLLKERVLDRELEDD